MPRYKAEFSILGSTTGGYPLYARSRNSGHSRFTVSRVYHANCDCGGAYQLTTLSHFGYLRNRCLKAHK